MTAVVLTFHTLIVLALIGVVLMQRSEGGALGMGAGTGGGFMTGRGAATALTRTTSLLAALFFATSLGLAIFADQGETEAEAIEELTGGSTQEPTVTPDGLTSDDILGTLGADAPDGDSSEAGAVESPAAQDDISESVDAEPQSDADDSAVAPISNETHAPN